MPLAEDIEPVVFAATHQREHLGARIGHVTGHVKKILEKPDPAGRKRYGCTLTPESNDDYNGENELAQGAAI